MGLVIFLIRGDPQSELKVSMKLKSSSAVSIVYCLFRYPEPPYKHKNNPIVLYEGYDLGPLPS